MRSSTTLAVCLMFASDFYVTKVFLVQADANNELIPSLAMCSIYVSSHIVQTIENSNKHGRKTCLNFNFILIKKSKLTKRETMSI